MGNGIENNNKKWAGATVFYRHLTLSSHCYNQIFQKRLKASPIDYCHNSNHDALSYRNAISITSKLSEFQALVFTSANPDVELTTETWLNSFSTDSLVTPRGCLIFCSDRPDDRQGEGWDGAFLIKDQLPVSHTPSLQTIENVDIVSVLVGPNQHQIFVCYVYRPHDA